MTSRNLPLIALLLCTGTAHAGDAPPPTGGYQAVMRTQYAAKQSPTPANAAEAERIYQTYLQSIGKPKEVSGGQTTNPSH